MADLSYGKSRTAIEPFFVSNPTQDIPTWVVEYVTNELASLDLSEIYGV